MFVKTLPVSIVISSLLSFSVQADNEFLGTNAGASNTSGDANVIIGDEAGKDNVLGSRNVILGNSAATAYVGAATDDHENVFIGYQTCLGSPCQVNRSVFVGTQSGFSATTGLDNVFLGHSSGYSATTARESVFVGYRSGQNVTTGLYNVFIGDEAGQHMTASRGNTALGRQAMQGVSSFPDAGWYNTVIGYRAGVDMGGQLPGETFKGARNTTLGTAAGYDIGGGLANTMLGDNAGSHTESGDFNTFVGFQAGYDNNRTNVVSESANRNVALGAYAGYTNRGGQDNLWLGALADSADWNFDHAGESAYLATSASAWNPGTDSVATANLNPATDVNRTTVVGNQSTAVANDTVTLGHSSRAGALGAIAIGTNTNSAHANSMSLGYGATSKLANTVVIGSDAARGNTTSIQPNVDAVTALGTSAYRYSDVLTNKVSVNAATGNAAEIDLFADAGAANNDRWTIAAADAGNFTISSYSTGSDVDLLSIASNGDVIIAGDVAVNSDHRLKTNIEPIRNASNILSQLEGKRYNWKPDLQRDSNKHLGLIAQEVEKVLPELVVENDKGIKSVNYVAVVPVLINALNEQQAQIDKQQQQIEQLMTLLNK